MGRCAGLVAITLAACGPASTDVTPPLNGLSVPGLSGVITVADTSGERLAEVALELEGGIGRGRVPDLPPDVDLTAQVTWRAAGLVLAATDPIAFRVEGGDTHGLEVPSSAYRYPDDDGDGAVSLVEVIHAAERPGEADAPTNPAVVPHGFASGFVGAFGGRGVPTAGTYSSKSGVLLVARTDEGATFLERHDLDARTRTELPLPECRGGYARMIARGPPAQTGGAAVLCASATDTNAVAYVVEQDLPLRQASLQGTIRFADLAGKSLSYGRRGRLLYTPMTQHGVISWWDVTRRCASAEQTGCVEFSDFPLAGALFDRDLESSIKPFFALDTGDWLLATDLTGDRLVVLEPDPGLVWRFRTFAVAGALSSPSVMVRHPLAEIVYVANGDGLLRVVDISNDDPEAWTVSAEIDVGPLPLRMAIEPLRGAWIYVVTTEGLARIDTLTHQVTWQAPLTGRDDNLWPDVAVDPAAVGGALLSHQDHGVILLGHPKPGQIEREPNDRLGDLTDDANTIGPPPALVAGRAESDDAGEFILAGVDPDLDDLWTLRAGDATSVAVAVFPTRGDVPLGLALVDGAGRHVATASAGRSVAMLTSPSQDDLHIGVDAKPSARGATATAYELATVAVPEPFPEVAEREPNGAGEPMSIVAPVRVRGELRGNDLDCFSLPPGAGRVVARLDGPPGLDVFGSNAAPNATPERYYAVDPVTSDRGLCVRATTSTAAAYRLTVVDFDPAYVDLR